MNTIHISLLAESEFDELILRRILQEVGRYEVVETLGKRGKSYLKDRASNFNQAAKGHPYILMTDLDADECPPELIGNWLPYGCHHNLVFRVAVREVEAWLLADRENIANFLKVPVARVPLDPDTLNDPKGTLIDLARRSPSRDIQDDIVPEPQSTSKVGKDYNGRLSKFIWGNWNLQTAAANSPSLGRAYQAFTAFEPVFQEE